MTSVIASALRGLYAVIDRDDPGLARALVDPAGGGACALQLRMKRATTAELLRAARRLRPIAGEAGALFIVNDRVDVALSVAADGVHLGQEDLSLADARRLAAAAGAGRFVIGVSTHNLFQVEAALAGGADYLGFGPVFATATKEAPDPVVGVAALAEAARRSRPVPVVAIGGITAARAQEIADAGAAAGCAISAVNGARDPAAAGRRIGAAWRAG